MPAASSISPTLALTRREIVRFLRQRNRVIGALMTPVVFWLLLGLGLGRSFAGPGGGEDYLRYFFPGVLVMIVLFTAIFSTISIIEDRREGFLQSVLISPAGTHAIALAKVIGGAMLAVGQAMLFMLLAPLAGVSLSLTGAIAGIGVLLMLGIMLTALGLLVAWPMNSTQGFHVVMNLLLMPMWMLCGAVFPMRPDTALPIKMIMFANPLSYGQSALRQAIGEAPSLPVAMWISLLVSAGFTVFIVILTLRVADRPRP
jgi:ABC-2 type transport system permease protein